MSHTPGPWRQYKGIPEAIYAGDEKYRSIASVNVGRDNHEDNARLITAAPDMLVALKYVSSLYDGKWKPPHVKTIDKLIAKAEGQS